MNLRKLSPFFAIVSLFAFMPAACGGDSSDDDDTPQAGNGGKGGSGGRSGNGSGGSSGKAGSAGNGGSSGKGGSSGSGGGSGRGGSGGDAGSDAGASGEGGGSGQGASAGEGGAAGVSGSNGDGGLAGSGGGEAGAGGAPTCAFADDATVSGTLKITTDDNYRLYVNGALIDDTVRIWSSPQTYPVSVLRHPSRKNVIAVEGTNAQEISGLDRGIIVDLSFDAGAGAVSVLSDTSWKLATTLATDWFTVAFDDSAWVAPFDEGAHGIAPYNNVLGTSAAHWIWAYDSNVPADQKPDPPELVWVRKSFYVNAAGAVTAAPESCP